MKKNFLFFTPIYIFSLLCVKTYAQDPIYSQFYAAPLQLNPAFAGNAYAPFIAANYRSQFASFNNGAAYSTYSVSYDQFLKGQANPFYLNRQLPNPFASFTENPNTVDR